MSEIIKRKDVDINNTWALEDIYSSVPKEVTDRAERLCRAGLINYDYPHISLTNEGMLLSNSVILELTV